MIVALSSPPGIGLKNTPESTVSIRLPSLSLIVTAKDEVVIVFGGRPTVLMSKYMLTSGSR